MRKPSPEQEQASLVERALSGERTCEQRVQANGRGRSRQCTRKATWLIPWRCKAVCLQHAKKVGHDRQMTEIATGKTVHGQHGLRMYQRDVRREESEAKIAARTARKANRATQNPQG
jgi:hypothetical protein